MHTPGPWTVSGQSEGGRYITVSAESRTVARVLWNKESTKVCTDADDARLIAAAPELLDALTDAEFLLRKAAQIAGPMQDSFKRSAEDARAAIAKATQ